MSDSKAFWLLTAAVFVALLLPAMVQQGMFLDGVSYACISKNMANGLGTFSRPYYTATLYPVCHEQPPLVFWLQSMFFKVFGDHFWVERLYSMCAAILTAVGIVLNWRLFAKPNQPVGFQGIEIKQHSWLPVLLWVSAPIVFWSYQNNMLECTMSVFVLFSVYFAVKSILEAKTLWLLCAAMLTVAAVLCKGPVGFFPVAVPLAMAVSFQPKGMVTAVWRTMLLAAFVVLLLAGFIFFVPGMRAYLDDYLLTRLFPTLSGSRDESVGNRLHFMLDLASQFAPWILLLGGMLWKFKERPFHMPKQALFFFLLSIAGTLPLVLSPKQSPHYLLPAIPFFALGFGVMFADWLNNWHLWADKFGKRQGLLEKLGWLFLIASIVFSLSLWGKYRRDEQKSNDVEAICQVLPSGAIISTPEHFSSNWSLIAYFARLGNISLDSRNAQAYYLAEKDTLAPEGYVALPTGAKHFEVWKK